ncbi:hypothetical protein ABFX02_02G104100 [Erythranthe guttata]
MTTKPRVGGVLAVFEEFNPISEWKQDDILHSLNLIINLPGFTKDQIRVSTQGRNTIRVAGERFVAGNKWIRFTQDFQAPENTEMDTIRAKLQGGILNITVPQKTKTSVLTEKSHDPPKTTIDTPKTTADTPPNKAAPPPFEDKISATQKTSKDDVPQLSKEKVEHASLVDKDDHVINKTDESSKELPSAAHREAEEENGTASKGKKVIESDNYGAFTIGRYKKAVKGITQLSEERQLLVNVGVAVLVIVSVSAYVTYKFASRKDKN